MPTPRDFSQDEQALVRLLDATLRRVRIADSLRAVAVASIAAALFVAIARTVHLRTPLIAVGAVSAFVLSGLALYLVRRDSRTRRLAAARLEDAHPGLHNVVITGAELLANPERTPPYMRARVFAEAVRLSQSSSPKRAVGLRRPFAWLLVSVMSLPLAALVTLRGTPHESQSISRVAQPPTVSMPSGDLLIEIYPPAYAAMPLVQLHNPASLEALEGSRAVLTVALRLRPRIRINGTELSVGQVAEGFRAESVLSESGYVAVDAVGSESGRRLVPMTVRPDRAPDVRITAPAKDLRIPDTSRSIPLEARATDDLAIGALEIRYTKVSGTGEQFEFEEGTLPIATTNASNADWRARAELPLAALRMEPGDAVIYRAVARDRRPGGGGTSSSDTYFVEIAGPGEVALAGFEMPPDRERYLLSQAMIVLNIERLRARERTMAAAAVREATASIAAEQRAVRANFIFLLGGEVEDEEHEAETSTEIAEGRFENRARREITLATRLMAQAEQALVATSTATALPPARDAARALQRAFGHDRYLLRALPERTKVDPSRRLSGETKDAADWQRQLPPSAADPLVADARHLLRGQLAIARSLGSDPSQRTQLAEHLRGLAERLLTMAAGNDGFLGASRDVLSARDALLRGDTPAARAALQRSVPPVLAVAQRGRVDADSTTEATDRVAGALAIEVKR